MPYTLFQGGRRRRRRRAPAVLAVLLLAAVAAAAVLLLVEQRGGGDPAATRKAPVERQPAARGEGDLEPLGGGVAYFAHIGGFAFGLLAIKLFASERRRRKQIERVGGLT